MLGGLKRQVNYKKKEKENLPEVEVDVPSSHAHADKKTHIIQEHRENPRTGPELQKRQI